MMVSFAAIGCGILALVGFGIWRFVRMGRDKEARKNLEQTLDDIDASHTKRNEIERRSDDSVRERLRKRWKR